MWLLSEVTFISISGGNASELYLRFILWEKKKAIVKSCHEKLFWKGVFKSGY